MLLAPGRETEAGTSPRLPCERGRAREPGAWVPGQVWLEGPQGTEGRLPTRDLPEAASARQAPRTSCSADIWP